MIDRALVLLLALMVVLLPEPVGAHSSPNSQLTLDLAPGAMRAEVIVPQSDYAAATGLPVANQPANRAAAQRYIGERLAIVTLDGRPWVERFVQVEFVRIAGPPDLHAVIELTPPSGASGRDFRLQSRMIFDRLPDHFTLVRIGNDLAGAPGSSREVAGMLTAARPSLAIKRGSASGWNVFANSFMLGAHHIAVGYDHLLFLLALLLSAPLIAAGTRWGSPRPMPATIGLLAWIVTGFTLGHSLTLALASLFDFGLPTAPVEALIALSVLVSAIHAVRPLFPRREPVVAFVFGTVHGLAFATLVGGYAVGKTSRGIALLGFNLGIEAIQLAIVAAALPALLIVSRRAAYRPLRLSLAGFAAIAAAAWLAERVLGRGNAVAALAEAALPWLGAGLALLSLGALGWWIATRNSASVQAAPA